VEIAAQESHMDGLGIYDVIIIGAGPAGLTAALYCAQANLRVLAIERLTMGGKILDVERIENYPGFADGVNGAELGGSIVLLDSICVVRENYAANKKA
jgi:phytoene dehydrogenase-like protein